MMEEILTAVEHANTSAFPYTFFSFISLRRHDLLEAFSALFAAELDVHAEAYLRSLFSAMSRRFSRSKKAPVDNTQAENRSGRADSPLEAVWKSGQGDEEKSRQGDKNYLDDLQHMIQERSALHSFIKRNKKADV